VRGSRYLILLQSVRCVMAGDLAVVRGVGADSFASPRCDNDLTRRSLVGANEACVDTRALVGLLWTGLKLRLSVVA